MIKKAVYLERSPAKINLYLDILDQRKDGYHNIETLFQAIDLEDHLTFSIQVECGESEEIDFEIEIDSNSEYIKSLGLSNSVTKAIETYFAELPEEQVISLITSVRIEIFIDKHVPAQAGLAGGSANAAATLRAINRFFEENFDYGLNNTELAEMALQIGSDVPFCLNALEKPRQFAESRGEKFSEPEINFNYDEFPQMIIVKPNFGISTKDAYQILSERREAGENYDDENDGGLIATKSKIDFNFYNAFENIIFDMMPELLNIQEDLESAGCDYVLLSGSGSAMLGFVHKNKNPKEIIEKLSFPESYEITSAKFL